MAISVCVPFIMLFFFKLSASQYGTPPFCLLHVLDIVPCEYRNPATTDMPEANEFGNYSTRIRVSATGQPQCVIRRRNHNIRPIDTLGYDERVKFIYSPGIQLEPLEMYGNQLIVFYNISCPANHIAFFNISFIDLEPANCFDPNLQATRCVDYVQVIRPNTGITESCGSETSEDNIDQLEQGNFQVIFRTSDTARYDGFQGNVICFKAEDANLPGCTTNSDTANSRDKRRTTDTFVDFNEIWQAQISRVNSMRKQQSSYNTTGQSSNTYSSLRLNYNARVRYTDPFLIRIEEFVVPHRIYVLFEEKTLFLCDARNNKIQRQVSGIHFLYTFDSEGVIRRFRRNSLNGRQPIHYRGPGTIRIAGRYAFFVLFIIDPRDIFPSEDELTVIHKLSRAQFSLVTEDENNRISQRILESRPINFQRLLSRLSQRSTSEPIRYKRNSITADFTDEQLLQAILNENACNPVLRTSAQATLNFVLQQPGGAMRTQSLREHTLSRKT